jgi:predicted transporter
LYQFALTYAAGFLLCLSVFLLHSGTLEWNSHNCRICFRTEVAISATCQPCQRAGVQNTYTIKATLQSSSATQIHGYPIG